MKTSTSPRNRAERRDRALALRRRVTATMAAAGVAGVGVVGIFVAQSATPATTVATVTPVTSVTSVGDDAIAGDDGLPTSLSPSTATAGSPGKAATVTGGSTVVVKKP